MNEKLKTTLEQLLDEDFATLEKMENFKESENWDSLKYVSLVVSLESVFQIQLKKEDIRNLLSVASIKSVLIKNGVQGIET